MYLFTFHTNPHLHDFDQVVALPAQTPAFHAAVVEFGGDSQTTVGVLETLFLALGVPSLPFREADFIRRAPRDVGVHLYRKHNANTNSLHYGGIHETKVKYLKSQSD